MARKDERKEYRDRLEKLFRLLDSPNENEALAALQALKKAVDKPWQEFTNDLVRTKFGDFAR
jgi:hypothetical protein